MVTLRNTVLPLLLVLCTSGTAIYAHPTDGATLHNRAYKDLTKEQMDKVDQIEMPKCYDTCAIGNSDYIPLCAHTDQDTPESEQEEAIANSYSCICTDKLYLETQFSCLVKQVSRVLYHFHSRLDNGREADTLSHVSSAAATPPP